MVFPLYSFGKAFEINEVSTLTINSAITPASYDYLDHKLKLLPKSSLVLIKINTPGGLLTTTKDIISLIGNNGRPVAIWITPEGASASSAGAIIASAAHFIFMAPGTNMGAATPIGINGDIAESDGKKKALNDLNALVRSLSDLRERPSKPFEEMITEAKSFTDQEALKLGIITGVVSDQYELIKILQGRSVSLNGVNYTLEFKEALNFDLYPPTFGQQVLEVLASPTVAYILFLLGVALIYFELQAPGGFVSGSIGAVLLVLSGISFHVLPLDWGSFGLIGVGIILLVLEIYVTSYGVLSIGGLLSLIFGTLFLFHGDSGLISVEYEILISTLLGVVLALGIIIWYILRENKKQKTTSHFFLPIGAEGVVLKKNEDAYQVKVNGEIWNAFSDELLSLEQSVDVIEVDPIKLTIKVKSKIL